MAIKLIVDSSADLPQSIIDQYNIKIIPLSVHFGDEEYLDYYDMKSEDFYKKLADFDGIPTTSQIPPERFIEYIQPELDEGNSVIVVTIGSNASGTCQSAHIARDEMGSDKITIIDSNALCGGTAYIAIRVARLIEEGKDKMEIIKAVEPLTQNAIEHLFCVDTLEYLRKGGRIRATQAVVAEILNIKPILNVVDSITQTISKVRGRKKVIPFYIKKMAAEMDMNSDYIIVAHAHDKPFADKFIVALREELKWDKEIIETEIGTTIGTHAGPGVLSCYYMKK